MEHLRLPSGATVVVEKPRLSAVLLAGGSEEQLIEAIWAHQMDAALLDEGDRRFLAEWCVVQLSYDEEATALAAVCEKFGGSPAQRLRITDPVLAFTCDSEFTIALAEARNGG